MEQPRPKASCQQLIGLVQRAAMTQALVHGLFVSSDGFASGYEVTLAHDASGVHDVRLGFGACLRDYVAYLENKFTVESIGTRSGLIHQRWNRKPRL